ncbi:hypothetical protein EXIGLDRAFT_739978 [Exidia glandulosa HHB12029]|uniref:DNA-directed RNA polymerase III subunit RPC3 n=1 Tax=Exidia glandulosa HHB12029 TaxID=1314781 RepID=A0A165IY10_EXIGL|nr:hypothetical protein EXIGLDRAFT_739978 [Exidia glandulosa HHB12029]
MADSESSKLCVQIIHEQFGPLTSQIASVLLHRGRLSMPQLARALGLKSQTVRAAVIVLVQHNVLWHAETDDRTEVMEINVDECIARLRFGQYIWLAKEQFGTEAAAIVQLLLDHGKLRLPDILDRLHLNKDKDKTTHATMVHKLLTTAHLKPSTVLSHICPRDKLITYEAEELKKKKTAILAAKDIREAKELAVARLRNEEQEAEKIGLKRKAKDPLPGRASKKQVVEEEVIDEEVYFRVNYAKFNVHIRNNLVVAAASERYNDAAGAVVRATLKAAETKQVNVTEVRSDAVTTNNIMSAIPEDCDLSSGIKYSSSKKQSTATLVKEFIGILSAADNPTPAGLAGSFLSTSSTGGKIQVEFDIIHRRLRRRVLEAVVRERWGDDGVRIIRIILSTGKMDDKHIAKVAMKAQKEVRTMLAAMNSAGIIAMQEVPKGADRAPIRTFYLWHVDLPKTYAVLLRNLYKTLFNIQLRKHAEEVDNSQVLDVIAKAERGAGILDETLLMPNERKMVAEWREKRRRLTVLEMRVLESVFVLKELGGSDVD